MGGPRKSLKREWKEPLDEGVGVYFDAVLKSLKREWKGNHPVDVAVLNC